MDQRVAKRYAQALMDIGEERKALETIVEDLLTIESTVHGSRELRRMLESPVITPDQKLRVLTEIFGKQLHQEVLSFVTLLVRKGRAGILVAAAQEFRALLDQKRNILHAIITSATELSEDQQMIIQAKLENMTGKRIRATFSIDPSLKGGFIARLGDTQIDASLSHQLEILRAQFRQGGAAVLN